MTRKDYDAFCKSLPHATHVVQWGDASVWKIGGKVFAICGLRGGLSFKVSEVGFVALTEGGPARQAPYLHKGSWVIVDLDAADDTDMADWLTNAHALIAAKLTRLQRRELGLG